MTIISELKRFGISRIEDAAGEVVLPAPSGRFGIGILGGIHVILETNCQRTSSRMRVLMTATIVGADAAQPARVNELTSSGARIACDRPLAPGSDVIFKRGRTSVAARVAWSRGESAGLEFYRELPGFKIAA